MGSGALSGIDKVTSTDDAIGVSVSGLTGACHLSLIDGRE